LYQLDEVDKSLSGYANLLAELQTGVAGIGCTWGASKHCGRANEAEDEGSDVHIACGDWDVVF